jgi:hypothetical protein
MSDFSSRAHVGNKQRSRCFRRAIFCEPFNTNVYRTLMEEELTSRYLLRPHAAGRKVVGLRMPWDQLFGLLAHHRIKILA